MTDDVDALFGGRMPARPTFTDRLSPQGQVKPVADAEPAPEATAGSGLYKPYGFMPSNTVGEICEVRTWVTGTDVPEGLVFQYRFLMQVGFVGDEMLKLMLPDAIVVIPLSGYETRLAAQAVASERSLSSTILQKALKFLNSGLSVTNSTNHLFDAGIEKLEKLIAEQRQAIFSLEDKRKKFESDLRHHSELKAYFDQRIKEIEAEIIALTAHVAHIDKTNMEWRMPFEWVARITPDKFGVDHAIPEKAYNNGKLVSSDDKLQQINKGTFVLFLVTTALSIFDDILIDIARKQPPSSWP